MEFCVKLLSLPLWERGLKSSAPRRVRGLVRSLPLWERGLKYFTVHRDETTPQSLPLWERGLKFCHKASHMGCNPVAPLVGAWIEIAYTTCPK